jgi:hypothetical protein
MIRTLSKVVLALAVSSVGLSAEQPSRQKASKPPRGGRPRV